jgi:hypothetical protein
MTSPIPDVLDVGRRVARTVVQAALAVVTLAPIYPLIVAAIGVPKDSNVGVWIAASVAWVATAAGIISRVMAVPAVNSMLGKLSGHSGDFIPDAAFVEPSTETQLFRTIDINAGEFIGDPAH